VPNRCRRRIQPGGEYLNYIPVFICIAALCVSFLLGYTPLIIPATYLLLSLVTLLFYAIDKSAARKGDSRVAENTLHALALAGGWPGAMIGQQMLRHKTIKTSFRIPFWITVLVNSGALVWLHTVQRGEKSCFLHYSDPSTPHYHNPPPL